MAQWIQSLSDEVYNTYKQKLQEDLTRKLSGIGLHGIPANDQQKLNVDIPVEEHRLVIIGKKPNS